MMYPTVSPTRTSLSPDWHALLEAMATLDRLQVWVGNSSASLVRWVRWDEVQVHGAFVDFVGEGVHVRLDLAQCALANATECPTACSAPLVFSAHAPDGTPVLEFRFPTRVRQGFESLVRAYRCVVDATHIQPVSARQLPRPNDDIDVAALRAGWDQLGESRSMHALLQDFDISFAQCCRLAGDGRVRRLSPAMAHARLLAAEEQRLDTLVRVHNPAATAAHIGPICATRSIGSMLHLYACCGFGASISLPQLSTGWELSRPGAGAPARSLEFVDDQDTRQLSIAFPGRAFLDYL